MKTPQTTNILAPRPVHPRAIRNHGLFGATFVKQHRVIDDRWSEGALIDEFQGMANLLSKRLLFKHLENKAFRKTIFKSTKRLRTQCRDGRSKLQNILCGDNVNSIRNYLIRHKDMQRLYQKMPVHLVVDNINQRTFVMRKERDRLNHRLKQLKMDYELKCLERSNIGDRIKYQNEFILDEELQMRNFMKDIENSNTRLRAIKTINATYRKVIQILRQDDIFYEPILRSLCQDIDDQGSFIKHILYLGMPAIKKFKQLNEEYRQMEDKSRKQSHMRMKVISGFNKPNQRALGDKVPKPVERVINISKHYTRETKSMLSLKNELETIEATIKQIKVATLCSHATEIFPRIKSQVESNTKLIKQNYIGQLHNDFMAYKEKLAAEKQSVLLHSYYEEEERRIQRILALKEELKAQDEQEMKTLAHMKNRAAVFVILRYTLWNLWDIMRFVGRPERVHKIQYPTSYLKLPLLKFEMLTMYAVAPDLFEGDTKSILQTVLHKLKILVRAYDRLISYDKTSLPQLRDEYHQQFLASLDTEELQEKPMPAKEEDEEQFEDVKTLHNIPNRKQLKALSAKLVEELAKKEDN